MVFLRLQPEQGLRAVLLGRTRSALEVLLLWGQILICSCWLVALSVVSHSSFGKNEVNAQYMLSLIIISLRPFARKLFDYEGYSFRKPCSCEFSAELLGRFLSGVTGRLPGAHFFTHLLSIWEQRPALGRVGRVREVLCLVWALPAGSPAQGRAGNMWVRCQESEAMRIKVGRRPAAPYGVWGDPELFQYSWAGPPMALGQMTLVG